jgi:hypothetical protein
MKRQTMKRQIAKFVVLVAGMAAAASVAQAEGPSGDVFLEIVNGRVEIGRVSEDGSEITRGERVFIAELGEDAPGVSGEPGFQSLESAFDPAGFVGFNFRKATRQWNGTDFSTIAGSIIADYGPLSATTPATDAITFAMNLPVEANGEFHEHPTWTLGAPQADGVYLVELEFFANNASVSDPVWILWSQNATTAERDAAYEWAEANIPAPGAVMVGLMGLAGASLRRRRA